MWQGPGGRPQAWWFDTGEHAADPVCCSSTTGPALVDAALAGMGIAQAFEHMVADPVRTGQLAYVLPEHAAKGPDVHAVCAPGRRTTARIRAAFDAFTQAVAGG